MPLQPRFPRVLRLVLTSLLLVGVAAAGMLLHAGLRGASSPESVREPGLPTLVFAEFGANVDSIYVTSATDTDDRTLIHTVEHAPGWGLNPAAAVVAGQTAYTVLPPEAMPYRGKSVV